MVTDEKIILFANEHGIDIATIESVLAGVNSRIEHFGFKAFSELSEKDAILVLEAAFESYMHSMKEYYERLEKNIDSEFDRLCQNVYSLLK